MFRAAVAGLVLVAFAQGAPLSNDNKAVKERQFGFGDPWTGWGGTTPPSSIPTGAPGLLPPITGGFNPPPKEKRDGPVLGGSDPSAEKARIVALELEYESLVQAYGSNPPRDVAWQLREIAKELQKYGITIVQTPGGSTTIITPGKAKRDGPVLGGSDPSAVKAYITALELEYEALVQQYGSNPPKDVAKELKEIAKELKKYGITIISTPGGSTTIITPGKTKRDGPVLGGSDPSAVKAYIVSLELEYEALVQQYGSNPPKDVARELKEIAKELKKYGITIISTPDGTTTTITPGKTKRQSISIGSGGYGSPGFDLAALETTLESLMQQYGPNPPHDVYVVEENIKHILLAYGITIIRSPDGTTTTIYPSPKRAVAADYDIEKLEVILEALLQKYDGTRPPLADWLVIQHITTVLKSYGITIDQSPDGTVTIIKPSDKREDTVSLVDSVNVGALQSLQTLLTGAYGASPPRDILLIEQTIATIVNTVVGSGTIIPGGPIVPDPFVIPGGPMTPDPTVPGGPIKPSDKRDGPPALTTAGLLAALAELESQYGAYGSGTIPVPVFIIMQNIVTILQAEGVTVPGWPILIGPGSSTIGPSP